MAWMAGTQILVWHTQTKFRLPVKLRHKDPRLRQAHRGLAFIVLSSTLLIYHHAKSAISLSKLEHNGNKSNNNNNNNYE